MRLIGDWKSYCNHLIRWNMLMKINGSHWDYRWLLLSCRMITTSMVIERGKERERESEWTQEGSWWWKMISDEDEKLIKWLKVQSICLLLGFILFHARETLSSQLIHNCLLLIRLQFLIQVLIHTLNLLNWILSMKLKSSHFCILIQQQTNSIRNLTTNT